METKECQFCCSQIPAKASKCKFCTEWQEEDRQDDVQDSSMPFLDFIDRFPGASKPFQLKLVEKLPLHYIVSVIIICALIFASIQFSWYRLDEDRVYLLSFLAFTIQMTISWAGLIWIYRIISDNYPSFIRISSLNRENAESKYISHHGKIFSNGYSILVGVIVGGAAAAGDHMVGTPFVSTEARVIFAIFEFVNMFFAGSAVYSMLMYAIFVQKISGQTEKDSLRLEKSEAVVSIGKIHLRTCILAIVPLFLGVIAKLFGDWSWEIRVVLWYSSFAIAIIVYIYWPMLNIHRLMQEDIERQTNLIQKKLQDTLVEINTNQSVRSVIRLNELRELERSVSNESTWPFDPKSISAVFFAIVFPILLMIVDKIWSFG